MGSFVGDIIELMLFSVLKSFAEWFPVSENGHYVLGSEFFGIRPSAFFDAITEIGVLLVITIFFSDDIVEIFRAVKNFNFNARYGKMALFIVIGSFLSGLVSVVTYIVLFQFFYELITVGIAFILTGLFLSLSRMKSNSREEINAVDSLLMGFIQGLSIIPGLSRTGLTLSVGFLRGLKAEIALVFSFLLYIPVGFVTDFLKLFYSPIVEINLFALIFGEVFFISISYLLLFLLSKVVLKRKLYLFSIYCWAVGAFVLMKFFGILG